MGVMSARDLTLRAVRLCSAAADRLGGRRPGPRLLIYHQVGEGSGLEMDVSVEMFEYQMRWLRDNGELVTMEAAVSPAGLERTDSSVVTFDDGHSSLWQHALPILVELGIPFLLYVCSAPLDGTRLLHDDPRMPLLSWDDIQYISNTG